MKASLMLVMVSLMLMKVYIFNTTIPLMLMKVEMITLVTTYKVNKK